MSAPLRPDDLSFDEIREGEEKTHRYTLSTRVYEAFLVASQDYNPLHTDDGFAKAKGFSGKVMHGALLNAFLSHFVGMVYPGRNAMLLSADLQYSSPSFLGDELELTAKVDQKVDATRMVLLHVRIQNLTTSKPAARGKVQVKVG